MNARKPTGRVPARRGIILLIVLVVLAVASALVYLRLRQAIQQHRVAQRATLAQQTDWLATAGLDRAAARLAESPDFAGETWIVPGASLSGIGDAEVDIRVAPSAGAAKQVTVTAIYPRQGSPSTKRRISRTWTLRSEP
ncbi:MAG: hypothetical protein KDA42_05460 [Planctomycetales bacterium]|nr:hypothetical protein [Planctomycetales bacterium]